MVEKKKRHSEFESISPITRRRGRKHKSRQNKWTWENKCTRKQGDFDKESRQGDKESRTERTGKDGKYQPGLSRERWNNHSRETRGERDGTGGEITHFQQEDEEKEEEEDDLRFSWARAAGSVGDDWAEKWAVRLDRMSREVREK